MITLITAALPSGPMYNTGLPIAASAGLCAWNTLSSPPTSTVMSPCAALCTPPVTGDSRICTPFDFAISPRRMVSLWSFVLMSTQVAGVARPASDSSTPPGPATTASIARGDGKHVNTVSDASQSSLIEPAHFAPLATSGLPASALRSKMVTSKPLRTRLPARNLPM